MRTRFKAISIALSLSVIVVMVPMETASGYGGGPHELVTWVAMEEFNKYYPDSEPNQNAVTIGYGAWEEDEVDLVFGYSGEEKMVPHFWDADEGWLDPVTMLYFEWDHPNAWQKISGIGIGDYDPDWPYMGLWHQALYFYSFGNKVYAYSLLGHIAHLIQDMSVPAHVHEDAHPLLDIYEHRVDSNYEWVCDHLDPCQVSQGLIQCPAPFDQGLGAIGYLMYTTNQRADFFGSEGDAGTDFARGDMFDPLGWIDPGYWPLGLIYYRNPGNMFDDFWMCDNCRTIWCYGDTCGTVCSLCGGHVTSNGAASFIAEHYTLVYAMRATATLFEVFLKAVTPKTSLEIGDRYTLADGTMYISPDSQFTLTTSDETSTAKVTSYRVMGDGYDNGWQTYSGPFTFNQMQAGLADGLYTILYRSLNGAGNLEADESKEVYLTTKPGDYRVSLSTGGSYFGIQAAIDAAQNGTTIEVKPGTFRECVDFKGKAIVLRSIGGAEVTTINADGGLHVVTFANAEDANSILDGFTITGGNASGVGFPNDSGAGILCNGTQPVICNCIITNNYAELHGGGVYFKYMNPLLRNCLIYNNTASNGGGLVSELSKAIIANCTFSANVARVGPGGAIASFATGSENTPVLINCIVWENTHLGIACEFPPFIFTSDIQNILLQYYPGCRSEDPKFVDPVNGNFHLAADSPCIGTGNNAATYDGEIDLDGYPRILDGLCDGTGIVDMGAYEFSYAYRGDLDTNCTVDFADLAILAAAWMHEPADRTIDIEPVPAGDGTVNILDFSILAEHWMKEI